MFKSILGLEGWEVLEWLKPPGEYHFVAQYTIEPDTCPKCGVFEPRLYVHAWKDQQFRDIGFHGKHVSIVCQRPRYKCRECGETFQQPLPDMDERRFMTKRLLTWIGDRALKRTFAEVAGDVGVDEKTVRLIFADHVAALEAKHVFSTPTWLGIDELMLMQKLRCILTNVAENAIYDILPDRRQPVVTQYLLHLPNRQDVELVAMDMWQPYKAAARAALPQARVVVDRFHVVRTASYCLDMVRKSVRAGLTPAQRRRLMHDRHILLRTEAKLKPEQRLVRDVWLTKFPALRDAYDAKEGFYAVYEAQSRLEAKARLDAWQASLSPATRAAYKVLLTSVKNWEEEILTFFDYRVTNAYTEALNGLAKVVNRQGRGYSFAAIRAKMLFSGEHRVTRTRYQRPSQGTAAFAGMETFGVSIPNLTAALRGAVHDPDSTQDSG